MESSKTSRGLTNAKVAEKAIELIRSLMSEGYHPHEVFIFGKCIYEEMEAISPAARTQLEDTTSSEDEP